jgi:ribosomal protein S18 acetylase RimI-like enzyme
MKITIEELDARNIVDVNQCDAEFIIDAKLVLQLKNNEILYTMKKVPVTTKRYASDRFDFTEYIHNEAKVVFLAYVDGRITGQIILRKNWNRYAYIEDITVDAHFRRAGIGKRLIARATDWAKDHNLMGIMLETQDNNTGACRFYESCGFQLRGFDTYLYKGIDRDTDEIALYWYMYFEENAPG